MARGIVSFCFWSIVPVKGIKPFMWNLTGAATWHEKSAPATIITALIYKTTHPFTNYLVCRSAYQSESGLTCTVYLDLYELQSLQASEVSLHVTVAQSHKTCCISTICMLKDQYHLHVKRSIPFACIARWLFSSISTERRNWFQRQ